MYERYREGLIKRHICKNGRFLQHVLLAEQRVIYPHPPIKAIMRVSDEPTPTGVYRYEAFPVLLNGYRDVNGQVGEVVGGGDNPLLFGGLAMAFFALESFLGVSEHSYNYALRLFHYLILTEGRGCPYGWFKRKRNHWHPTSEISKDELCGVLLGLHFLHKAAKVRGDQHNLHRVDSLMARLAKYLKEHNYSPAGAWLFQFPFTRIFKFNLGSSHLCGRTFPSVPSMGYTPKGLYFDTMKWLRHAYAAATVFDRKRNFFNVALYLYTALMIHDNPVNSKVRNELWSAFREFFQYFSHKGSSRGSGAGAQNAYLGLMARTIARSAGREQEVDTQAIRMYKSLLYPREAWCADLPLCDLPAHDNIAGAAPFGGKLWGECFTWQHSDHPHGHVLNWSWAKTSSSIGPHDLSLLHDARLSEVADTSKGFRVEGAGLGLLLPRVLAAYFNFAAKPKLENDEDFPVLPVDGPRPE